MPGSGDVPGRAQQRVQAALAGLGRAGDGRRLAPLRGASLPRGALQARWGGEGGSLRRQPDYGKRLEPSRPDARRK